MSCTRPDLNWVVSRLSKHLKQVLRYVKRTLNQKHNKTKHIDIDDSSMYSTLKQMVTLETLDDKTDVKNQIGTVQEATVCYALRTSQYFVFVGRML